MVNYLASKYGESIWNGSFSPRYEDIAVAIILKFSGERVRRRI